MDFCSFADLGWSVSIFGIAQLPLWAAFAYFKKPSNEKWRSPFKPSLNWGPKNPQLFESYQKFIANYEEQKRLKSRGNIFVRAKQQIFG